MIIEWSPNKLQHTSAIIQVVVIYWNYLLACKYVSRSLLLDDYELIKVYLLLIILFGCIWVDWIWIGIRWLLINPLTQSHLMNLSNTAYPLSTYPFNHLIASNIAYIYIFMRWLWVSGLNGYMSCKSIQTS
jgi:hypothetical protein